jgi:hypothetical protein
MAAFASARNATKRATHVIPFRADSDFTFLGGPDMKWLFGSALTNIGETTLDRPAIPRQSGFP